jgi:peptide/nickel transport system substrate-binding protein
MSFRSAAPVALLFVLAGLLTATRPAAAADLVIGRASEQSSTDPLFSRTGNNGSSSEGIFERLVSNDANNQLHPALAVSWRAVDPLTWEIKLRDGVKFHDGGDFTAADVVFSLDRAKSVPNSPASFAGAVGSIAAAAAIDRLTVQIKTTAPTPQLIEQIGIVYMVSHRTADATTNDYNSGKAMIGTGPYKFVEWLPAQRLVMERNPGYWGTPPDFDRVTLRFIPKEAARVAALLAGDVDLIDQVPPSDVKSLGANAKVKLYSIASTRLVYLALDSARDQSPFVTDAAGKPLDRNPLKDVRVRRAISKMIDRKVIVDRLLDGSGEASAQMVPEGVGGFDPSLPPPAADVAGAKALLAEAGYSGGFGLTIHSSSDRFPKDSDLAQAIGQMLTRGGIKVNGVAALPYNVYASAATRQEYSAFVFTFGTTTSNSAIALTNVLASFDRDASTGVFNRARYSNPEFDRTLREALAEFDDAKRNAKLAEATHIAFTDLGIVPLYWLRVHWAARKGIAYEPRRDEATLVTSAHRVE